MFQFTVPIARRADRFRDPLARLGRSGQLRRAFKMRGETMPIRYATVPTSLGPVLVAAGAAGLRAVRFGDDAAALAADFRKTCPSAVDGRDDAGFGAMVAAVVARIEQPGSDGGPPIDAQGSDFERKVWQALRSIPPGTTRSYKDIAATIGEPGAARAVARACAANPVAVLIPCHRVVRQDGDLGGYRWGVARKRALLTREGARP